MEDNSGAAAGGTGATQSELASIAVVEGATRSQKTTNAFKSKLKIMLKWWVDRKLNDELLPDKSDFNYPCLKIVSFKIFITTVMYTDEDKTMINGDSAMRKYKNALEHGAKEAAKKDEGCGENEPDGHWNSASCEDLEAASEAGR